MKCFRENLEYVNDKLTNFTSNATKIIITLQCHYNVTPEGLKKWLLEQLSSGDIEIYIFVTAFPE